MANYREDIVNIELSSGTVYQSFLTHTLGGGDGYANRFGVKLYRNSEPEDVTGAINGYFIRADGYTVAINGGWVSGNEAYITLPAACYEVEGKFTLSIKLTGNGVNGTIRIVEGVVSRTSTASAVNTGNLLPNVENLIEAINDAVASIPEDYSELSHAFTAKAIINDLLATSLIPGLIPMDTTGIETANKAWRANASTPVDGSQYFYKTYSVPGSYAGNVAVIYGHGWGEQYPLACFYNSNMELIMTVGERPDTAYKGLPVIIPNSVATIVINGKTAETFPAGIYFASIDGAKRLFEIVTPYGKTIETAILTEFPSYADVRNLPGNAIYSLGQNVYSSMTGLPPGLNTYATLIKLNGNEREASAYNTYICVNQYNVWFGFQTDTELTWKLITGEPTTKYLFIGDSYGDGYSHDGNNSGWCTYLANEMGLSASQYEAVHQGGSGFANGGFLARLNAAVGTNFSDIVVLGGFNDYNSTEAAIDSAMSTFCARVKTLFPSARLYIGCVGWIKEGTGSSAYSNWEDVRDAITGTVLPAYQACGKYGAQYINFSEYLLTDDLMTPTDGYHPGEDGNKAIAHGVINAFKTGCACLPFNSDLKG